MKMDVIRRDTDYALRAMVNLAKNFKNGTVSAKTVADKEGFSYQLACKLMQRLHNAGLVTSSMGPKGGFHLSKEPSKISLLKIIEAVQGPLSLNSCLFDINTCSRGSECPVRPKIADLQKYLNKYLSNITLEELIQVYNKKGIEEVRKGQK